MKVEEFRKHMIDNNDRINSDYYKLCQKDIYDEEEVYNVIDENPIYRLRRRKGS